MGSRSHLFPTTRCSSSSCPRNRRRATQGRAVVDSQLVVQSNAAQLPGTSLAGSATAAAFAGTNGPVAAAIAAPPVIGQADRIAAAIASGAGAAPAAASAGPLAESSGL